MPTKFQFRNTRVSVAGARFLMHSITAPWGEDDPILRQLREGRFDEHDSIAHWVAMVRAAPRSAIILDVGAFAGLFSLVATSLRPDLLAIAFEPSSVTFGRLAYNIQLNGLNTRILPAHLAAWDKREPLSLPHKYGVFTLCPGERASREDQVDHSETVMAVPLDALLTEPLPDFLNSKGYKLAGRPVAAVKIDVEGVEPRVLSGAKGLIERDRPAFICEALNTAAADTLASFFGGSGYSHALVAGERNMVALPGASALEIDAVKISAELEPTGA